VFRVFLLIIIAVAWVFAKDWRHYTNQNAVYDTIRADNGALWAAFAWGLQERSANGQIASYMPGNNGLEAANFVQIFALPGGDIVAASKNGVLVRKNRNSKNFETINNSYVEKKRNVLPCLGKRAGNILILPFENAGALAFFDYTQSRSVITISQIGESSLESSAIKRIAVKNDTVWLDLGTTIWKREIVWNKIHDDRLLADPTSWKKTNEMPPDEKKCTELNSASGVSSVPGVSNSHMKHINAISVLSGVGALVWGNNFSLFSKIQNEQWIGTATANQSNYVNGDDQKTYVTKSMAMLPNGDFAFGFFGAGVITYSRNFQKTGWFHSTNSDGKCPTTFKNNEPSGWTIVQGITPAPDYSGYIFSYFSETNYGLGFADNNGNVHCKKSENASSGFAYSVIARNDGIGKWEIYTAWRNSIESKDGGVDFYSLPGNSTSFSPGIAEKKWKLSFGSPIDFAFDNKGILWAVSSAKIFYLNKEKDEWEWKEPSYVRGFDGGIISALETDARGGLWIGTFGDGAYSFSQINNSPDSLTAKRLRIKDGLLNETIHDIAIDTIKGLVYFGHDLGLSIYSTTLVRNASGYMQSGSPKPIAYPNPFRPELHNVMKIDYINENSSLYIFDSSGKRVRFFKGNNLLGGMAIWDGRNESGNLVAPGLYYYVASDKKNVAKGKILVER
jgi:hypothetical protein